MSFNAPKDRHSDSPSLPPLLRNALTAIFLSAGLTCGANDALSAPKSQEQINAPAISKNPPKPDKSKITEAQQRCGLIGTLRLSGKSIIIEVVCVQGKKITLGDVILSADKSGHFNIPRTTAYFYLSDAGEPALSFIKDGERMTGMMKCENGTCSFDQYLEFIE